MRTWSIVLLVVGVFLTLIVTFGTMNTSPHEPLRELWFQRLSAGLPQVFGVLVSVVSALALLAGALHRDKLGSLLPLVLSLLAGVLLVSQHWLIALAFAALGVAALVPDWFRKPTHSANESPTSPV